jgi:protein O-GlcNAc transferase
MSDLAQLIARAAGASDPLARDAAIDALRDALAARPDRADAWHDLGALEMGRGRVAEARAAFAEAARLRPAWAAPCYAAGHVAFSHGDFAAAAAAFEAPLTRAPDHLAARVDLAQALMRLQRYSLALPHLTRARRDAPDNEAIWWLQRGLLLLLRRDEAALAELDAYLAAGGDATTSRVRVARLASARRGADPVAEARALQDVLAHPFTTGESALCAEALSLVQYHDVPSSALHALATRYDALVTAELGPPPPRVVVPRADDRLSIGYLSADFRDHVMGAMLLPVLAAHDRTRFRVMLLSLAPRANADAITARFAAHADAVVELAALDDAAAAAAVAATGLDVLVDLMGHSAFARPGILARKPAPVIVTHLGYHGGVGLSSVDFKVTDAVADLADGDGALRERLLRLDGCVMPLRAYEAPVARDTRASLGLADDAVVIGAFVGVQKLSPRALDLWRRVLDAVPSAVLLFSPPRDDDRIALMRRVTALGIAAERVRFVPWDRAHGAARYALVDVVLDTVPYTGGDTTLAALAAGVPVVTRIGRRHAERVGASLLVHAGLDDLVAADDDAFVVLAVRLCRDAALRAATAARVRRALSDPARTDPVRYTRSLERALVAAHASAANA